jgi:hypothetical protein
VVESEAKKQINIYSEAEIKSHHISSLLIAAADAARRLFLIIINELRGE